MDYFQVRNWREFQHYHDRNPPWIKLHFALLSSPDWVTLDDAGRVLAVACMLIASRHAGLVPVDNSYVRRVAYLNADPDFKPLIECGFLEHASITLAQASTLQANARPEERQRRDTKPSKERNASRGRDTTPRPPSERWRDPPSQAAVEAIAKAREMLHKGNGSTPPAGQEQAQPASQETSPAPQHAKGKFED